MNVLQSLENLALIKVVISIYHSSKFSEVKEKIREAYDFLDVLEVKQLFWETVSNLVLPIRLREKLLDIIPPIIMDIETWNEEKKAFGVCKQLDICLSSFGTIDRKETVKKFVRSENKSIVERFTLACHFWMTDDVLKIWNKLSVEERIHIEMKLLHPKKDNRMLGCLHERTEERNEQMAIAQCLRKWFDWLRDGGDPSKQQHFLDESLLTFYRTIPEPNLLRALPHKKLRDLMKRKYSELTGRDYFSCLDHDLKLSLFQDEPFIILHDYLRWPLQFKFLEMASQAWKHMTGNEFYLLLWCISDRQMPSNVDFEGGFDYEGLLHEFWKQSPHHLKISAKEQYDSQRCEVSRSSWMAERRDTPFEILMDSVPSVAHL